MSENSFAVYTGTVTSLPTQKAVLQKLEEIIDPEIGHSIVGLGLVYDVALNANTKVITIHFTMTSPACPLEGHFRQRIIQTLSRSFSDWTSEVAIIFDPPWSAEKIRDDIREQLALMGMPL